MVTVSGKKIILRSVIKNDLEFFKQWRNNHDIWKNNTQYIFLNMLYQNNWYSSLPNSDKVMFTITNRKKNPIGVCGFTNIDFNELLTRQRYITKT